MDELLLSGQLLQHSPVQGCVQPRQQSCLPAGLEQCLALPLPLTIVIYSILFYFIIVYYNITKRSLDIHVSCHPVLVNKKKSDPTNSSSIAACHSMYVWSSTQHRQQQLGRDQLTAVDRMGGGTGYYGAPQLAS